MLNPLNNQATHGEGFIIRATLQLKNNFQSLILPGQFLEGKGHLTKQVLLTENRGFSRDKSNYLLIPILKRHSLQARFGRIRLPYVTNSCIII